MTRAKKKLYITYAMQRMLFGSTSRNLVSRFVKEIPADYVDKKDGTIRTASGSSEPAVSSAARYTLRSELAERNIERAKQTVSADYSVGQRVKHNVFGEGTIVSVKKISNDAMLEVAFDSVGTKKIMANYAKLTKI